VEVDVLNGDGVDGGFRLAEELKRARRAGFYGIG